MKEIADTRAAIDATEEQIAKTRTQLDSLSGSLDGLVVALDELEKSLVPPGVAQADIVARASAEVPFAEQSGYYATAIKKYVPVKELPETGINGPALPNGSTLRLGKVTEVGHKALAFVVINTDPETSNGYRSEIKFEKNIEREKTYWVALAALAYDWGTLSTNDDALFGCQCHQGNDAIQVGGPSFSLYTSQTGRVMRVQCRYSTAASPSASNSTSVKFNEHPIPFGKWMDLVFKFRHSTKGTGFLKAWIDGAVVAEHAGNLGYNVAENSYMKFGYYNWSGQNMGPRSRKVLVREPTLVLDPTGDTYTQDQLRALLQPPSSA